MLAGFVAQIASDARGDIGPFQLAIALTFLALGLVARWPENYGDAGAAEGGDESTILATVAKSFATAKGAILGDRRVALLAAVSALCEGATFTFVFMWVPTLLSTKPRRGIIRARETHVFQLIFQGGKARVGALETTARVDGRVPPSSLSPGASTGRCPWGWSSRVS